MAIQSGTHLGPYEIVSAIGAGGMGEVYRARDPKLGRDVAIKVLPQAFAGDAARMARFQREAKVLASLDHPNIASIYGLEESGGTRALVMQLVEGPTLADRIKAGPIPVDESVRIARQIADALEYAHEHGIIHRDLKPANVKVTADDAVKVLDFSLAKALEGDPSPIDISTSPTISRMATQAGVLLGTAAYMAPEQAKAKPVDRRADIWAFGCVLYEMLTGKVAFPGDSVTDTLAGVIRAEPDWSQFPSATPMRVRVLLQRCLQKDPKERLQAIGDARIALNEVLSGAPDLAPVGSLEAPAVPRWRSTLPWALFGVAAVAFAALAFVHFREKPPAAVEPMRFEIPLPNKATIPGTDAFALSPDGRQLAFSATGSDGIYRMWIRSLDSLETRPVPGSESFQSPAFPLFFWSPDSRYIAFDAGGKLKKRNVSSGETEDICDLSGTAYDGSWRNDLIIFAEEGAGIMRVSPAGSDTSPLTSIDSSRKETAHDFPSFLPDGRHFVYLRLSSVPENRGVYIGSLDAKAADQSLKRLLAADDFPAMYLPSSDARLGQLLFVRNGTLLAQTFDARRMELKGDPITVADHLRTAQSFGVFSASENGVLVYRAIASNGSQLTWFDRQGKVLGTVGEPGSYGSFSLSPDGMRAAFSRRIDAQNPQPSLWLVDFSRGTTTRFTFGSATAAEAIWSPDGKRIIFASNPSGVADLYQKPASGAEDQQLLLKSGEAKLPSSISRDGRFLLYFARDPKRKYGLWVLPLTGDQKPFPFLHTRFNEVDGHFSPDGHWVAYASDESGHYEIYVRRFSGDATGLASGEGAKWQVSYGGGREPRWSADGKELYYMTLDGKVMAVGVSTNTVFEIGTPKLLFQMAQPATRTTGDYTVDGKRFLFLTSTEQTAQAPFTVVLNWPSLLKK